MVKTNEPIVFGAVAGAALLRRGQVSRTAPECARTIVARSACARRPGENAVRVALTAFDTRMGAGERKTCAIMIKPGGGSALRPGNINRSG